MRMNRRNLRKRQAGNFSMFPAGTAAAAGDGPPVVTLSSTNVEWTSIFETWANLRYNTSGTEEQNSSRMDNFAGSRGDWLDSGSSADVWFERTVNSGSLNNSDPGSGRKQMTSSMTLSCHDSDVGIGAEGANLDIEMWDASSGGNSLDDVAGLVMVASWFDACPTCCFPPETLIAMGDGTSKAIGKIKAGELISKQGGSEKVGEVIVRDHRPMCELTFEDGRTLVLSIDHPIYIKGKGMACVQPETDYKALGMAFKLEIGDYTKTESGILIKLVGIDSFDYPDKVYTFSNSLFFAGGILVY